MKAQREEWNPPYDRYELTINGRTYNSVFTYLDIQPISETFKNVEWRLIR